jgi:prepilin-type N-terminal cleavage/methylation domain-containing protein
MRGLGNYMGESFIFMKKGPGMKSPEMPHGQRGNKGSRSVAHCAEEGFSLIEMLVATFILAFGLLAAGQMIYVAMNSSALARAKGNITVVAQDKLEFLADLYARNPNAADLTAGDHGPDYVQIVNPLNNATLNRFQVTWNITGVSDPRAGKSLQASQVKVTVRPVTASDGGNYKAYSNKAAVVVGILSPRTS